MGLDLFGPAWTTLYDGIDSFGLLKTVHAQVWVGYHPYVDV
jgi:hypothetical protein